MIVPPLHERTPEALAVRHGAYVQAQTRRIFDMTENAPLVTILCSQCSRHAQVRRSKSLPEGWADHGVQLSCSEACREILQSMGLISEE